VARRVLLTLWLISLLAVPAALSARDLESVAGDSAMAGRYVDWAAAAVEDGRWAEAETALERAVDFAGVSSDISYLLAYVRFHENRPGGAILNALLRSLDTNRWNRYALAEARLLEAEILLRVRAFAEALRVIALIPAAGAEQYGAAIACLRLRAMLGLGDIPSFQAAMARTLEDFPRDAEPVRILFHYAAAKTIPDDSERALVETALKRLPLLLDHAPDLAYLSVPFMRDTEEAGRLVSAYRAAGGADPAAIPAALNLGILDETMAIEELFRQECIDKVLLLEVWRLLRNSGGRELFMRNLNRFSGVLQEDGENDGYAEIRTRYESGSIAEYTYDANQDGLPEWQVFFNAGSPIRAGIAMVSGTREGTAPEAVGLPLGDGDIVRASLLWERYPALLRAGVEEVTYGFNPWEFSFAPFLITGIPGNQGLPYPEQNPGGAGLTTRALVSFASTIERPSREFRGAVERVSMERGIPQRAAEYLDKRMVSVTEFARGRPALQGVDLDLDGRMETVRYFRPEGENTDMEEPFGYAVVFDSSESDWDGDGIYETGEEYFPDGSVARSWDLNGDGIREYTVINP
jgi:hypothetical protein